ncbi:hypothetical protein IV203_015158 [Nitzschia inconspicua]|uniref:Uncharacterized protein n=1 Tax=Nitzschia inconspicua TaxID=303405 RepID=A0A9K3LBA8_9STRA|nr:hypothetical protein IV203_015158 [Nitzschia inconspicua]
MPMRWLDRSSAGQGGQRTVLLSVLLVSLCVSDDAVAFTPRSVQKNPRISLYSSLSWNNRQRYSIPTLELDTTVAHPEEGTDSRIQLQSSKHKRRLQISSATTWRQWKNRLITKEDPLHSHKATGMMFVLSSLGLVWYGLHDLFLHGWTAPVAFHGAPFVGFLGTLTFSSVAQSFSSIHLACHHRQGQPAVRNTFLCNAAVAILGSVSALWSSPWYPDILNGAPSKAFYLILDGIGLLGMADNLLHLKALIGSRQVTSTDKLHVDGIGRLHYWKDVFVYMMPILIGAPFFLGIGWQFGIHRDRNFYLNLLQDGRFPHLQTGAVYSMVVVAMGASYSSLVVTLRDKKLISKSTEGFALTVVMASLIASLCQALRDPGVIPALLGL